MINLHFGSFLFLRGVRRNDCIDERRYPLRQPPTTQMTDVTNLTGAFWCSVLEAEILGETDLRRFY